MSLETMKCPNCGAPLHFDNENQEYCFCSSCGTQVYKEDKHFDRKMDLEQQKIVNEHKEEMMAAWILLPMFIVLMATIAVIVYFIH